MAESKYGLLVIRTQMPEAEAEPREIFSVFVGLSNNVKEGDLFLKLPIIKEMVGKSQLTIGTRVGQVQYQINAGGKHVIIKEKSNPVQNLKLAAVRGMDFVRKEILHEIDLKLQMVQQTPHKSRKPGKGRRHVA